MNQKLIEWSRVAGVALYWQRGDRWVLTTPDGTLYLGELTAEEALEEYDTAVRRAAGVAA